jgi:polysaccharide biosynthesis/export protein
MRRASSCFRSERSLSTAIAGIRAATARSIVLLGGTALVGCAGFVPSIGPSRAQIESTRAPVGAAVIQVVDADDAVTRQLMAQRTRRLFSESLRGESAPLLQAGPGDSLQVSIWEAAPATLFSGEELGQTNTGGTSHATTLPEQMVDSDGNISVPFAGRIHAAGKTLEQIEGAIVQGLTGKANQPQVIVRMTRNLSASATVVGEVTTSTRVPLLPGNEHLLDAIAAAGGVKDPVTKTTIQITRDENVYSLPLETIIRDPRQNIVLKPGDVITALFQPYSFMALGATGKDDEVNFETQGISLAQALARAGALMDTRSNPKGVFIFRFEPRSALAAWPRQPVVTTPDGLVPVIYRIDLTDPRSFFVMQSFPMENHDVLFVSNAPVTELQKFVNLLFTAAYPIIALKQVGF